MPDRLPVYRPHRAEAAARDHRPSPSRRGYGRDWQRRREQVLADQPLCRTCGRLATEVDHATALARGGDHSDSNLVPLCKPCHSRKTCTEDGGLGRPRQGG